MRAAIMRSSGKKESGLLEHWPPSRLPGDRAAERAAFAGRCAEASRAVERHSQHTAELAVLSSQIDKTGLRKFYFAGLSVVVLMAIVLVVVFQSPQKREWLPQETDTILSVNLEHWSAKICRNAGGKTRPTNGKTSGPD